MPVVQIETNLKVADIPTTFVADFNKALAPVMGKDLARVLTNLKTNQYMTAGDNSTEPIISVRVWSFSVFHVPETRSKVNEFLYRFLKGAFPHLTYSQMRVYLHDMPSEDVGPKPLD